MGECDALRDECRAISEDLEVLVKENQVVNHQLTTASAERYMSCVPALSYPVNWLYQKTLKQPPPSRVGDEGLL